MNCRCNFIIGKVCISEFKYYCNDDCLFNCKCFWVYRCIYCIGNVICINIISYEEIDCGGS